MKWQYNDGGRLAAGFRGSADDCVVRAICIAMELPYRQVWESLSDVPKHKRNKRNFRELLGEIVNPDRGMSKKLTRQFIANKGWTWTPTMGIGTGCKVHLRADELPSGRLIVKVSKHIVAVIDGVIHDTFDPTRDGTRCVYGYWKQ